MQRNEQAERREKEKQRKIEERMEREREKKSEAKYNIEQRIFLSLNSLPQFMILLSFKYSFLFQ